MSSQSEIETGLFYFFPFLVRKGSWLFHLTLVMDHGELRMSFHVSIKQQYLYSWSLLYHTILPHSMTSFLFDFIPLKPQANACNIVGQQLPTFLDFTVCICLHTLLQVVVCCWTKFETGQTFKPTTPQHSYLFCDRWSIAQQCWIHLHSLPTLLGTHMCITHGLQSLMGCILPMMHCRSQHCWELLHPFAQCWELLRLFALSWTHDTKQYLFGLLSWAL